MKLYLIQWGYHSSNGGGSELDSVWTDKSKAYKYFNDTSSGKHLEKKNKQYYTDGDYWITISEINSDTQDMYA